MEKKSGTRIQTIWREGENEEQRAYAHWLHGIELVGNVRAEMLVEQLGSPKEVYQAEEKLLASFLPKRVVDNIKEAQKQEIFAPYELLHKKGIQMYPFYHPLYPKRLLSVPDRPFCLYAKGRLPEDDRMSLAIVGARDCSEYGRYVAEKFAGELAGCGVQIISGMARGIDGLAGGAAVVAGGDTYAVLGCGVDICYPSTNVTLYEDICAKGGVLSEYLPGTPPAPGLFPARNRIISGLADAVLVVEARQKSGTLITVDMALEQGREVFVVPGRITDRLSDGCNKLIEQGAAVALSPKQILAELGKTVWRDKISTGRQGEDSFGANAIVDMKNHAINLPKALSAQEKELLSLLDFYPISIEQIWLMVQNNEQLKKLTLPNIMEMLIGLSVVGLVKNEGGYYGLQKPL